MGEDAEPIPEEVLSEYGCSTHPTWTGGICIALLTPEDVAPVALSPDVLHHERVTLGARAVSHVVLAAHAAPPPERRA
jgi:hypothetical protein